MNGGMSAEPTHLPQSGWGTPRRDSADATVDTDRLWRRPVVQDVVEGFWSFLVASVGVGLGLLLVRGVDLDNVLLSALGLVLGLVVLDALVNPLLRRLAAFGSVLLALVLGVAAQLVLIVVVLELSGNTADENFADILKVLLVTAVVMSLGRWLVGATDTAYVVGAAMTGTHRWWGRGARTTDPHAPRGLLVVQLDGLSQEVVEHALVSGQAPNLDRWLRPPHRLDSASTPIP